MLQFFRAVVKFSFPSFSFQGTKFPYVKEISLKVEALLPGKWQGLKVEALLLG